MKALIPLFLIIACTAIAAAQCDLRKNEVDEFTGFEQKITKEEYLGKGTTGKLTGFVARIDSSYGIYFRYSADLGCVSSTSYAIVKFTDGATTRLKNIGKTDCGDYPAFAADVTMDVDSINKPIEKIRIALSQRHADVVITNPDFFIKGLQCVK